MQQALIYLAFVTTTVHCLAQGDVSKLLAESNPAIQKQLQAVVRAYKLHGGDITGDVEGFREIQKLKKLTDDKVDLAKQLAIFAVLPGEETQPMTAGK